MQEQEIWDLLEKVFRPIHRVLMGVHLVWWGAMAVLLVWAVISVILYS